MAGNPIMGGELVQQEPLQSTTVLTYVGGQLTQIVQTLENSLIRTTILTYTGSDLTGIEETIT